MAIQITNSGQHIKIVNGTKIDYANKFAMGITVNGDSVIIEEADGESHSFLYTEVSIPSHVSAIALADAIVLMI